MTYLIPKIQLLSAATQKAVTTGRRRAERELATLRSPEVHLVLKRLCLFNRRRLPRSVFRYGTPLRGGQYPSRRHQGIGPQVAVLRGLHLADDSDGHVGLSGWRRARRMTSRARKSGEGQGAKTGEVFMSSNVLLLYTVLVHYTLSTERTREERGGGEGRSVE